jgi:alpha-beta hydrolase superfamily lysophospholipase
VHPAVPLGTGATGTVKTTGATATTAANATATATAFATATGRATHWYPASDLPHRGTLVLLPGRGEHPGVYERFGRRLATDSYVVHVLDVAPDSTPAEVAAAVDTVAATATTPLVLAGSDTGALHALAAAVRTAAAPDALLLAGVPLDGDWSPGQVEWADRVNRAAAELDARTACPAHRGRLGADPLFAPGALAVPVPEGLAAAAEAALAAPPAVPVLLLHGAADPVVPPAAVRALAARWRNAPTLATVTDGRHDTFNDIQHRSVAALIIQWLERLRAASPALVRVEGPGVF